MDIHDIYRKAYKIAYNWGNILSDDAMDFERATNCSVNLTMSTLLPMVEPICGPHTAIECQQEAFKSTLNTFLMSVCNPGGGKCTTYDRVIAPVFQDFMYVTGLTIHLENYTTAGFQNNQIKSNGYGMITSDEGHRFLNSIQVKQKNGEAERAFLCKLWGGKGDFTTLCTGNRGFERTSMSLCLLIQPQPILTELCNLQGADGLLDTFLFIAAKPCMHKTNVVAEVHADLHTKNNNTFRQSI